MSRGGTLRYLPWMLRDAALRPGLVYLAVAGAMAFLLTRIRPEGRPGTTPEMLLAQVVSGFDWLVVFLAVGGIVSGDVASGVYRTLFSRPVSPPGYYLQKWLVGGAAVAAFVLLAALAVLVATGQFVLPAPLLGRMLLYFLLLGGVVFACSTFLRHDWVIALLLVILQAVLHDLDVRGAEISDFTRGLARALPPFHVAAITPQTAGTHPPAGDLLHAIGYGLALVGVALAVLWRRPLGRGGRA